MLALSLKYDASNLQRAAALLCLVSLAGCGTEQELTGGKDLKNNLVYEKHQSAVVNGTISSDDCYDVALASFNVGSTIQSTCSAFRVSEGVFMTAAHCVTPTRPQTNPLPSKWLTGQITFTFNPNLDGRNFVDQVISLQVLVPPGVANYSNAQWAAETYNDGNMIAADMAIMIAADVQGPWDKSPSAKFIAPTIGNTFYVAGFGIGKQDNNGNGSDASRRRFGAIVTQSISSNGIISFFGNSQYGASGDSGGPIYTGGGPDNRQIVGLLSSFVAIYSAQGQATGSAYNFSPNLSPGGPNYQWLNNALQTASQAVSCLATAYNNARSQCLQ